MHHHGGRNAMEGYKYIIEMVIQYHTTSLPSIAPTYVVYLSKKKERKKVILETQLIFTCCKSL